LSSGIDFAPCPITVKELERIGEGRQAELFAWTGGGVLKLFRKTDLAPARHETGIMRLLAPAGLPMPRILDTVMVEHRPGIVMERLMGPDQLTLLGRKPWTVFRVGRTLGRLHAGLHAAIAPKGLRPLKPAMQAEIAGSDLVPMNIKSLALADLDRLPDASAICHWDFHPGNVIETADGPKVIDWPNVHCGDRLADVARTLLILQGGALPPGAPLLVRTLTAIGRSILSRRYLREYRRQLPFRSRELGAWRRVSLVSRLTYGLAEERKHLLQQITRHQY
jgi:aminoglycoside phosphotransferase (APT) family kinase protein